MTKDDRASLRLIPLIEQAATKHLPEAEQERIRRWIANRDPAKLDINRLTAVYEKIEKKIRLTKADLAHPGESLAYILPPRQTIPLQELLHMIPQIGDDAGKALPFFASLASFADAAGGFFGVCQKPVMFLNDGQKKSPQYSGIPFEPFRTISGLIHSNPQRAFTIGLAVWPENPVGKPVENTGEILLICEPNITDVEAREHKAKYILKSRMCEMLKEIGSRVKHVWVNNKRKERNNVGICLTLALEWMVELVAGGVNGLGIQRNDTQGTKTLKRVKIGNPLKKQRVKVKPRYIFLLGPIITRYDVVELKHPLEKAED
ncbi:hypothetical protein B0H11DRAFT_1941456 [Mycena galericulata]|nr:hypothetical protein B0H11DRAFT_1941456 [Mycena galericulata]